MLTSEVEWRAAFPTAIPDASQMPQEWKDALKAAVDAGKIPKFGPSTLVNGAFTYREGSGNSPEICSSSAQCHGSDDVYVAQDGVFGVGFDDGPALVIPL